MMFCYLPRKDHMYFCTLNYYVILQMLGVIAFLLHSDIAVRS